MPYSTTARLPGGGGGGVMLVVIMVDMKSMQLIANKDLLWSAHMERKSHREVRGKCNERPLV